MRRVVTELVTTPRGAKIELDIGTPTAPGARPTLLLAPGAGYHRQLPVIERLFNRAMQRGFLVGRFDWAYTTARTEASQDGSAEVEDMMSALERLLAEPFADPGAVFVGGKSLGSIVAHQVAERREGIRGEVLLSPIMREAGDLERLYPGLVTTDRPALLVSGRQDAENCRLPLLLEGLSQAGPRMNVVAIAGDHSFSAGDEFATERNLEQMCELAVCWLNTLAHSPLG